MGDLSELIDTLDDDVHVHLTDPISRVCSRSVGVASTVISSGWVPFTGLSFVICWYIHSFIYQLIFCRYFVGYSSWIFELSVIVAKMSRCVESNGGFRYGYIRHYFGDTGRTLLPDILANSHMDTASCHRWPQFMVFGYRDVCKRKGYDRTTCPFCVRIAFDISVGR